MYLIAFICLALSAEAVQTQIDVLDIAPPHLRWSDVNHGAQMSIEFDGPKISKTSTFWATVYVRSTGDSPIGFGYDRYNPQSAVKFYEVNGISKHEVQLDYPPARISGTGITLKKMQTCAIRIGLPSTFRFIHNQIFATVWIYDESKPHLIISPPITIPKAAQQDAAANP